MIPLELDSHNHPASTIFMRAIDELQTFKTTLVKQIFQSI